MEEQRRIRTQKELQNNYRMDLEKEKMVSVPLQYSHTIIRTRPQSSTCFRAVRKQLTGESRISFGPSATQLINVCVCQVRQQMEEQVDQMSGELRLYLQRVRELEDMYRRLEEALEDERQMRQDEETLRKLQARYYT